MDQCLEDRKTNRVTRRLADTRTALPLVGRDDELRRLANSLTHAAEGQGGTILLTGQPGIGKTRLAQEALALARSHGFTVLEGRAYPLEMGLAYAPLLDAFGPLLRGLDPARVNALAIDLPDLGRLFGDLRHSLPPPLNDPALEKMRLFEAVMRFLVRLAKDSPVAVFIDDLHWADPATNELLHYLARGLSGKRALLLATYSANIASIPRGLRTMVRSLLRNAMAEEITLAPLPPEAIRNLVQGILGGEAPDELLALLDERAGGTPLFVSALIGALIDSGHLLRTPSCTGAWVLRAGEAIVLPDSIRRMVLGRLEHLSRAARRVLDLIAIMGESTPHTILRAVSDVKEDALLEALQRLQTAGLVAEAMDGSEVTYCITHPLIQEVAYAELPEMVRRRTHMAAITALERLKPEDVKRLARHYWRAGPEADPGRALTVLLAAGERARAVFANQEATRYYLAALAIVREGRHHQGSGDRDQGTENLSLGSHRSASGGEPSGWVSTRPTSGLLPWLLEQLGEVWERAGEGSPAVRIWNEALRERERLGDVISASRLHRRLALAEWNQGHSEIANGHLEAGLALLTEGLADHPPCQELAELHFVRYQILASRGDVGGVAETAAELLAVAEKLKSPQAEAEANLATCLASLWVGDAASAHQRALRALEIAQSASGGQELALRCRAHIALMWVGMRLGDHHLMRDHLERSLALAQRLGSPTMEVLVLVRLAYTNYISGAWDESLRCGMEAISLARRVGYPRDLAWALAERAMIVALQGDLAGAEACIGEVRAAFEDSLTALRQVNDPVDLAEAILALERGKVERALEFARGFDRPPASPAGSPPCLTLAYLPWGLLLLAEAQAAAGDTESALRTARKIVDLDQTGNLYLTALANRAEGLARQALGQSEVAVACLMRAYEAFTALEMPFEAARSLLEQAEVGGPGTRARDQATNPSPEGTPLTPMQAAQQSLVVFERLGAQHYANRARQLLREFGAMPPASKRTRLSDTPLSDREMVVARWAASGLTAAQIAERLTLSPRTVTTHLDHIYVRLGISTRAALTRYVIEAGLVPLGPENT